MKTVFYSNRTMDRAILNPTDTVKPVENFPEVCISTFSKRIIDRVSTPVSYTHLDVYKRQYLSAATFYQAHLYRRQNG